MVENYASHPCVKPYAAFAAGGGAEVTFLRLPKISCVFERFGYTVSMLSEITIQHALGNWTVKVLEGCDDVPQGYSDWHSFGQGFKHKGHAVAYLKRLAKHNPDKYTQWIVYEFKQRWFIATQKAVQNG